jgi:cytochrome c oxidase cbb3-type subunit III
MRKLFLLLAAVLAFTLTGNSQVPGAAAGSVPGANQGYFPIGPVPGYGAPPAAKQATDPFINNSVALQAGRRLFIWYNCYGCHGGRGGGGMGPSLRDRTWIYGSTDADIYNSISEGRGKGMPAWGLKIPQEQIWQIVAYIKSMRTPQEPDKP